MAYTVYDVSVTGGTANTKGAYTQIVASTPYASSRVHLSLRSTSLGRAWYLLDLATGAAAAETVVVANIAAHTDADFQVGTVVTLDVDVPASTRLALRCQCSTASGLVSVSVLLEDRALGTLANPVTYGAVTGSSTGTNVDPGGVANTKSSYVQLTASTSARIDAVVICVSHIVVNIAAFMSWKLDLATGAAASETVVLPDLPYTANVNADALRPQVMRLPVAIPAGTRLAVRCECSLTTNRVLAVTLIGLQEPASGGGGAAGAVAYVG